MYLKKLFPLALPLICAFTFVACNNTTEETETTATDSTTTMNNDGSENEKAAVATLSGTGDTTLNGTVRFTEEDGKVKMELQISVPQKANQTVAVHIHQNGSCDNKGEAAGGHWNPTNKKHGKWGEGEFHSGDIGNVQLDGSGNGTMELETDLWSIGGDANKDILNKSIVVHGRTDDFTSQPAGNAGARIGCGVIQQSGGM